MSNYPLKSKPDLLQLERDCLVLEWKVLQLEEQTPLCKAKQELLLAKIVLLDWGENNG